MFAVFIISSIITLLNILRAKVRSLTPQLGYLSDAATVAAKNVLGVPPIPCEDVCLARLVM